MQLLPVLYTDDPETLTRFYTAVGLSIALETPGWSEFALTTGKMALHKPVGSTGDVTRSTGYLEMGFACEADENLEAIQVKLRAEGFDEGRIQPEPFGRSLDVSDPEGRRLQINEATDR
ncbi:MAG: hypothetical protein LBM23_06240 [Propionibacteriaceae bacterium]|jgi:hypothetical protein|nr:hypothetical protein [Propionibacteriaceae bacterium]